MPRFSAAAAALLVFVVPDWFSVLRAAEPAETGADVRPGSATGLDRTVSAPAVAPPIALPSWAFPGAGPTSTVKPRADETLTVSGSSAQFTRAQVTNAFAPPDWRPELHPEMPPIVAHGRAPKVMACGYCHLPDGSGRPENAALDGLPAAYFAQQIAAMAAGQRHSAAGDDDLPAKAMTQLAHELTPAEVADAAEYFASVRVPTKQAVREVDAVPVTRPWHFLHVVEPGDATEPIAGRLLEVCVDIEAHERRDPQVRYVAYAPIGSIERGHQLALRGPDGPATSCLTCHGPELKGTPAAPPVAGQLAAYVLRQLLSFRNGTRAGPTAAPMQPVVAKLTLDDMVALSAFVASRAP